MLTCFSLFLTLIVRLSFITFSIQDFHEYMLQLSSIYVPLFREEGRGRKNWQYDVLKYPYSLRMLPLLLRTYLLSSPIELQSISLSKGLWQPDLSLAGRRIKHFRRELCFRNNTCFACKINVVTVKLASG